MDRDIAHPGWGADLAIAALAGLNSLAAFVGAIGLAGGFLRLDEASTARLPWGSTVVGAIALALVVAVPNGLLASLAARHDRRAGPVAMVVGWLLVLWIVVELAFLRELSFFHPLYLVVGLLLVWLSRRP